ncbi:hypothetical protein D3C72_1762160 [compost metagenome]
MASGSLHSQIATSAASGRCWVAFITASDEPPQAPVANLLASHCGRSAARHWPALVLANEVRNTGPQPAVSQVA